MVADHYGYKSDLISLRQQHPQTLKGMHMQQLMGIADALKLSGRALKLELDQLKQLKRPCILHWDMNHFVVLESVSRSKIVIQDPAMGRRVLTLEEASNHFTGIALELTPAPGFEKKDVRKQMKLSQFMSRVTGLKPILIQLLLLSMILQIFALAMPYYMQLVLDEVVVGYDQSLLTVLALGFSMLLLFNVATTAFRGYVVVHLGASLNQQLAFNLFHHMLRLPLDYFAKRHIGDVVSRFGSLQHVKRMITNAMVEAIIDGMMAITTLCMIFIYSPTLASVVCIAMGLYLVIRLCWYRPLRALSEEVIVAGAKEQSNFMESVRGVQTIKLFGIETSRQALWQNHYMEALNLGVRIERLNIGYRIANSLLFGVENILVVYLGAQLIMATDTTQTFSVGMLMAFLSYKGQLTQRFSSLVDKLIEFKMLGLHLERLADIAMTEQEKHLEAVSSHTLQGKLALSQVSFRYATGEPWLFQNIDLKIRAGESVAIVGPSGGGKTSLMKIMLGLYQPSEGKVLLDGLPANQLGQRQYRQQIAAVMQDDELLSGSIAENIAQFDPGLDIQRVIHCAKMAALHKDIQAMPMQYNSMIGDMGAALSGGQKQRLLLARALYQQPRILFLDEATSHLDINSEQRVNEVLKSLNITRVIIAHRPETIRSADRVIRLESGELQEVSNKAEELY